MVSKNSELQTMPDESGLENHDCVSENFIAEKLRAAGLFCTAKRVGLARLIFQGSGRHFTAEELYQNALDEKLSVSLATVYNTLNHFRKIGLLRELSISSKTSHFDTDISDHAHIYNEDDQKISDFPLSTATINQLPKLPSGMEITRVNLIVHVKNTGG